MMMRGNDHAVLQSGFDQRFFQRSDPFIAIGRIIRCRNDGGSVLAAGWPVLADALERNGLLSIDLCRHHAADCVFDHFHV